MKESEILSAENAVLQDLVERQLADINDTIQDCLDRMKG